MPQVEDTSAEAGVGVGILLVEPVASTSELDEGTGGHEEEEAASPSAVAVCVKPNPRQAAMTVEQFEDLDTEALITLMTELRVNLTERVRQILREQEINGDALTVLTQEDLERQGIPAGVVAQLLKRVPRL